MFYSPIHRACNVDLDVADGYFYMGSQVAQPFLEQTFDHAFSQQLVTELHEISIGLQGCLT